MLVFRRHPLTGLEICQSLSALENAGSVHAHDLSPGRALSEDVPEGEQLTAEALSYPIRSFNLVSDDQQNQFVVARVSDTEKL